jgi:FixJ family two-component response regulator
MSTATPTVFIVDNDVSVRGSLETLIESAGWRPETFASAEEFLVRPRLHGPSCLLLDITQSGIDGLTLQQRLAAERADLPVVMMTSPGDVPMAVRAMRAGAFSLLTKPLAGEVVLCVVGEAFEQSWEAIRRESETRDLRERYASLSIREREVMTLVVAGLLNKQVGGRLGITEITVKAHRGKVMRKMGANSLPHLVTMAAALRIAPPAAWRDIRPFRPTPAVVGGAWDLPSAGIYLETAAVG